MNRRHEKAHDPDCKAISCLSNEPRRSVRQQAPVQDQHRETCARSRWSSIEDDRNRYFYRNLNSGSLNPDRLQFVQMKSRCNSRLRNGRGQSLATLRGKRLGRPLVGMAASMLCVSLSKTLDCRQSAMIRGDKPCNGHRRDDHTCEPA